MKKIVSFSLNDVPTDITNINLCLGFFDGIHMGHQTMINLALKDKVPVGVLTFDTHPINVVNDIDIPLLTSVDDKAYILNKLNVSYLLVLHFDKEVMKLEPIEFINRIIKPFKPNKVFSGEDYHFGINKSGTVDLLGKYFQIVTVNTLKFNLVKTSSKNIRNLIINKNVKVANIFLGRSYFINGIVEEGNKIGNTIGFPTANIKPNFNYVVPGDGVYYGYASFDNFKYKVLISIGKHPTIKEANKSIIEVYFIDESLSLYNKSIKIEFVDYIRDIIKFDSLDDLTSQITKDKNIALKYLF